MDPNLILYPGDVYMQHSGRHYKHIEKVIKNNKNRNYIIIYNKRHSGKIDSEFNGTVKEFLDTARKNAKERRVVFKGDVVLAECIYINYKGYEDTYILDYGYAYDEPWKSYDVVKDEDGILYDILFTRRYPFNYDYKLYSPSSVLGLPMSNISGLDTEFRYEFIRLDDNEWRAPETNLYAREVTLVKRREERNKEEYEYDIASN